MDSHFHEISIGIYRQQGAQGPEFLVHTYSGLDGARERVESVTRTMVVLGRMEAVQGDGRRVRFACNSSHDFACRRVFLESCKWDPAVAVQPKPLTIFDKKSDGNVTVSSLVDGFYHVTGEAESDGGKKRRVAIGAGLVKLGEMEWAEGDEERFAFPCGHAHEKLVGLLLIRALNVRGVEREQQMAAARGSCWRPALRNSRPLRYDRTRTSLGSLAARAGRSYSGLQSNVVGNVELMDLVDAPFPEANRNPEMMARLAATGYTELGFDSIMPVFTIIQESSALGCKMQWEQKDNWPTVRMREPIWVQPDDIKLPSDFLTHNDTKCVTDAIKILKKQYVDEVAIIGKTMGPWTLGYHCFGVEPFLLMSLDDPGKTKLCLDRMKEATVEYGTAQIEAGADALTLPDHATGDLVSGEYYKEFLLDLHIELVERLPVPLILHICGKHSIAWTTSRNRAWRLSTTTRRTRRARRWRS